MDHSNHTDGASWPQSLRLHPSQKAKPSRSNGSLSSSAEPLGMQQEQRLRRGVKFVHNGLYSSDGQKTTSLYPTSVHHRDGNLRPFEPCSETVGARRTRDASRLQTEAKETVHSVATQCHLVNSTQEVTFSEEHKKDRIIDEILLRSHAELLEKQLVNLELEMQQMRVNAGKERIVREALEAENVQFAELLSEYEGIEDHLRKEQHFTEQLVLKIDTLVADRDSLRAQVEQLVSEKAALLDANSELLQRVFNRDNQQAHEQPKQNYVQSESSMARESDCAALRSRIRLLQREKSEFLAGMREMRREIELLRSDRGLSSQVAASHFAVANAYANQDKS